MRISITSEFVRRLPKKDLDVWDTRFRGLVLRCRKSGSATYRVTYGRGKWITLGRADVLTPEEARTKAHDMLSDAAKGNVPTKGTKSPTLTAYLTDTYGPFVEAQRKSGAKTLARLKGVFGPTFGSKLLSQIAPFAIERWRSARLKAGISPHTANRDIAALKSAINKAVKWRILATHPLKDIALLSADDSSIVRYLTAAEEKSLHAALSARDDERRAERDRSNAWRAERRYPLWPALGVYTDHLTPLVLMALHTGLRRGELLALKWSDLTLDPARAVVTVQWASAKSSRTRRVPLNDTIRQALTTWRADREPESDDDLVFGVTTHFKKSWAAVLTEAKIVNFRFHDCRHTFASKLVMAGVDLNTVRELLGHATIKMTLRYAHLAPEHKAAAVAKLVPISA